MLKKMLIIGVAMGLILPGTSILAQTAREQTEKQERTEKPEMLQKSSPAAGEQVRTQDRERTRDETQTREYGEDAKQFQYQHQAQKKSGQDAEATVSGDKLQDRDRVYTSQPPQRGDIVVFRYPKNRAYNVIFRVAAVPGDRIDIQNGIVHINSQPVDEPYLVKSELSRSRLHTVDEYSVPEGHVFVLGDNRDNAMDSRYWGPLPIEDIVGKAAYIWSSTKKERIGAIY